MANEYLIQKTTLTAIANAIREKLGEYSYTIKPANISVGDEKAGVLGVEVTVAYTEYVDDSGKNPYEGGMNAGGYKNDTFQWYNHVADNNGVATLVLYKTDSDHQGADVYEPFFHVGRQTINGVEYDKWRKIEQNPTDSVGDDVYVWGADEKCYIYTNVITDAPTNAIGPLDMPAKIMSISGGEDLSAELAAQDELIADIKTAVAGKAGGGDTSEPPMLGLTGYNNTGENMTVHYLTYENGAFTYRNDVITPNAPQRSFYCVDKSLVYIATKSGYSGDYVGGRLTYVAGGDNYCVFYINSESSDSNEPTFDFS